jgi:hypothetical protein
MGFVDQVSRVESGGNPNSRNANSSASGPDGFINGTWLDMLAKHRPDITGSRDDLLALKTDPNLAAQMTAAYAADNAGILKQAGLPVTSGTEYLAHFAGPQGAKGILNADPSTPAGAILGQGAVKANPFLAGMTAGDVAAWANRKMGGSAPMSIAGPGAGAGSAPAAPAQSPQPAPQPQQTQAAPQVAAAAPVNLAALAAVPQLSNILPPRPNVLLGRYQTAPFSLRG